jgi:PPOX class probable F420-dependent enzyme
MSIVAIPESHRDLLVGTAHGALATMMPDGQPQSSIVWVDYDGEYVLLNTTLERQKGRNMQANPKVTLLVVDPADGSRWIEVRGTVVEMTEEGAVAHADKLTQRYSDCRKQRFYGDVYPAEQRTKETRVIVKIAPAKISLDAIFR